MLCVSRAPLARLGGCARYTRAFSFSFILFVICAHAAERDQSVQSQQSYYRVCLCVRGASTIDDIVGSSSLYAPLENLKPNVRLAKLT